MYMQYIFPCGGGMHLLIAGFAPGGGGGLLWYFHIYVGSVVFWGTKFWISIFFGGFQKNKYFLGYDDFVDIFGGHHKIGLYLEVISMHFESFLIVKVQNGG